MDLCDRSLNLQRPTVAKSGSGAATRGVLATYAAAVSFAVAPASDAVVQSFDRRDAVVDYTLWTFDPLAPGAVRIDDVAVDPATGERFVVVSARRYSNSVVMDGAVITELHCRLWDS